MKPPARLQALITDGLIDTVARQLKSGKEADVYVVRRGDETLAAKVYKEAHQRNFRQAVDYTENRKVRNGVLLMELVADADGDAAPRLNDLPFSAEDARQHHATLITGVLRMLCAGVIHGDLSEFNILLAPDGPVIIDLPQAVDAAGNNHAPRLLLRDVDNLRSFFGRSAPELLATQYGPEIWSLYAADLLSPGTPLTGRYEHQPGAVDLTEVLREIEDARLEESARVLRMGS